MGTAPTARLASRLADRSWVVIEVEEGARSRDGKVEPWAKKRPPMSQARFLAVQKLLGWRNGRLRAELRISARTIGYYRSGQVAVPRVVELALMFCLIRDQPKRVKENSELLARIP